MNNSTNKKRNPKLVLTVIITVIAAALLMVCGYMLINGILKKDSSSDKNEVNQKSVADEKADETSDEAEEILKDGGSLIVYVPDIKNPENASPEDMEIAKLLVRSRLDSKGYVEAIIETDDSNRITVAIPGGNLPDDAADILKSTAKLEFLDADGNIIMDGSSKHITKAEPKYGQTTEFGESQHYIELTFTNEGREKFKEATQVAVAADVEKQYITIALDGTPQMSPHVNEVIDSESCIITGNYTENEARNVANLINSGLLPFSLRMAKLEYVAP